MGKQEEASSFLIHQTSGSLLAAREAQVEEASAVLQQAQVVLAECQQPVHGISFRQQQLEGSLAQQRRDHLRLVTENAILKRRLIEQGSSGHDGDAAALQ